MIVCGWGRRGRRKGFLSLLKVGLADLGERESGVEGRPIGFLRGQLLGDPDPWSVRDAVLLLDVAFIGRDGIPRRRMSKSETVVKPIRGYVLDMHVLETERVIRQLCGPVGSVARVGYAFVGVVASLGLCLDLGLGYGRTPAVRGPKGLALRGALLGTEIWVYEPLASLPSLRVDTCRDWRRLGVERDGGVEGRGRSLNPASDCGDISAREMSGARLHHMSHDKTKGEAATMGDMVGKDPVRCGDLDIARLEVYKG